MKTLIFDSSTIITLALNNLLYILKALKKNFDVKFIIPEQVKRECIEKPLNIKRYELEALMINQLLEEGIFELPDSKLRNEISNELTKVLETANHIFRSDGEWIRILGVGESSCIALSNVLDNKKIDNILVIDERTARMLCEKPENLRKLLTSKLHREVGIERQNFSLFQDKKIIRSSELCFVAYKKGLTELRDGTKLLDALLYATKFKGCAISRREIETLKAG
ncbi:hypothetical protein HZA33_05450 [Candidatus Pacearchaeota archaeon]|nr:hypothetical protein [Candidatus Pacearchaeota archaeon]